MSLGRAVIACGIAIGLVLPALGQRTSTHHYTSPDGSFTFKYSDPLILCRMGTREAPQNWVPLDSCESQRPLCATADMTDDAIACVAHPHAKEVTTLSGAVFAVSVVSDAKREDACMSGLPPSDHPNDPTTRSIHGVTFKATTTSDAAMMQSWDIHAYRTFHAGKCFELTITTNNLSTGPYDPGQIKITTWAERSAIEGELEQTLESFRFLK
ncbi:MAG TPA: hypothetical protein VMT28_04975 [Terriglobales bacterium]|jgi:hypothetical protein|nr:hypothetical protein [Terriglobales bacterium]